MTNIAIWGGANARRPIIDSGSSSKAEPHGSSGGLGRINELLLHHPDALRLIPRSRIFAARRDFAKTT
jgi:hypothetical protein